MVLGYALYKFEDLCTNDEKCHLCLKNAKCGSLQIQRNNLHQNMLGFIL